jgi:hypothetical protein
MFGEVFNQLSSWFYPLSSKGVFFKCLGTYRTLCSWPKHEDSLGFFDCSWPKHEDSLGFFDCYSFLNKFIKLFPEEKIVVLFEEFLRRNKKGLINLVSEIFLKWRKGSDDYVG